MLAQADKVCPCCGQTLPPPGPDVHLTPRERTVFEAIRKAGKYGIPVERLINALYADHEDGGPLHAKHIVYITVRALKDKLAPFGAIINSYGAGRGTVGRYRYEQR